AGTGNDLILGSDGNDSIAGGSSWSIDAEGFFSSPNDQDINTLSYLHQNEGLEISLTGADQGTIKGDNNAVLTVSGITSSYDTDGDQEINNPSNQGSTDWVQQFSSIQRLALTTKDDVLRISADTYLSSSTAQDHTGYQAGPYNHPENLSFNYSVDGSGGELNTLDYSSFATDQPIAVNLSSSSFSFDFDANGAIDSTKGEITLTNVNAATNINVVSAAYPGTNQGLDVAAATTVPGGTGGDGSGGTPTTLGPDAADAQGGNDGIANFQVVIGGAGDDAIVGNDQANVLIGNAGDDRIAGGDGNDIIFGGKGDDYIIPGEGSDTVDGGQGINTILITSSDLGVGGDTFEVDRNGINIFKLNGDGGSDTSQITAPQGAWNPGDQGIDLLDGGDPTTDSSGSPIYDIVRGTSQDDTYELGGTALKNISSIEMGDGNDSVGTAPTSKNIKVNYDGGGDTTGDKITLNLTFDQFAKLNQGGFYVSDVQNYIDNPDGKVFSSGQTDFTATNFETGDVFVVSPGVYNALQGDPAALTFSSAYGARETTVSSGQDLTLNLDANATSKATALSVPDIVSAFIQGNNVKGADAVTVLAGENLRGGSSANQSANALAMTVDDRADAVVGAYGLGADRSSYSAGGDVQLTLNGTVNAATTATSGSMVANAQGTVEAAGSRDTSLSAGDNLQLNASGNGSQSVSATNTSGPATAGLASRTYGIDDANLTDSTADSIQAGASLSLQAGANSINNVSARSVSASDLGPITLVNYGTADTDRFTMPLLGSAFPLINGDRIRFSSTPAGGSLQANRDYYVLNIIPVSGEFQLSSTPAGDPINVEAADNGTALVAYRPAVANADAISSATAVNLSRSGVGLGGVQAGTTLSLSASASDASTVQAESVAGEASAGLNRLGGLNNLDVLPVSRILGLSGTTSLSGSDATLTINASDLSAVRANSTAGPALSEANVQVIGANGSASSAAGDLGMDSQAVLNLSSTATSTAGLAQARSGAGAGAGQSTSNGTANLGNAQPDETTFAVVSGMQGGSQSAGGDLSLNGSGSLTLNANASTVSGSTTLGSLWSNGAVLSTFDPNATGAGTTPSLISPHQLADGQQVRLDAANAAALGLPPGTSDYTVRLLASTGVNPATDMVSMPAGITYAAGDAIRFRLNTTSTPNSTTSLEKRYGLELGTTYYVLAGGSSFQLATAPGGPPIDLLADSTGLADQLVDADRFQLLQPPTTPGGSYTVPTLATASGVSVTIPSTATAFAGSRQTDFTLAAPSSLPLASVTGVDGGASGGGLMSLLSGARATIAAAANGLLNALARNVAEDATATAGLAATGLRDAAITAGSDATINTTATITATADAASTGTPSVGASTDASLASLQLAATGLQASNASDDISIGAAGNLTAVAQLNGASRAAITSGDSDALAALQATGLRAADVDVLVNIGSSAVLTSSASVGSVASPLSISALSAGLGEATAQGAAAVTGILGSIDSANGTSSSLRVGDDAAITAQGSSQLTISATATGGNASASLSDSVGNGSASVVGLQGVNLSSGDDLRDLTAAARGNSTLSATSVAGNVSSSSNTSSIGILGDSALALSINAGGDGRISAIASQSALNQALTIAGIASVNGSASATGVSNGVVQIGGTGNLLVSARTDQGSLASSISGNSSA
ncbi:MAG: hypothetical protein VKK97_06435, partial [Synechococcaceae cyanobacterium]|nr:hypothetical protein [Synechococcaceae cyanobacterium]